MHSINCKTDLHLTFQVACGHVYISSTRAFLMYQFTLVIFETLVSFVEKLSIAGLIIIQHGVVLAKKYRYGNISSSFRDMSQSCTKFFISTALNITIAEGKVSIHDTTQQRTPELNATPWGNVTLRDIINMGTGTEELEDDLFDDACSEPIRTLHTASWPLTGGLFPLVQRTTISTRITLSPPVYCSAH
jgi:hypothetical protein